MAHKLKEHIEIIAYEGPYCWLVKFPDYSRLVRDRTMVRNLVKHWAKEHGFTAEVLWNGMKS